MENKKVNAVGEACPIPVVKAMQALADFHTAGTLEVQVDNETAVQNLIRLADSKKLSHREEKLADQLFAVTMDVTGPVPSGAGEPAGAAAGTGKYVVAIDTDVMGRGSEELGRTLMEGFLYALSQLETLPESILFYNGGAKITTGNTDSIKDLKSMEAKGVKILTCGTCLKYYGLTDKLNVGSVTNMYDIVETLERAEKVIKP